MDEQLYLFEVFIDTIYFEECVEEVPPKKQIVVGVKLGNIITLEIRSESLPVRGEGPKKRLVDFKAGRSYLCSLSSEKLIETLDRKPFEVTVGVRGDVRPIGTSNAPWDDCFKEMVLDSTNFPNEYTSPASIVDNFCLMDSGAIKGNVQLLLRLSCFGTSVQTQFEVNQDSGHSQFVFKSANMATTFMCTKFGTGTSNDFIPFYPIYNVAGQLRTDLSEKISQGMIKKSKSTTSWTTYLDRDTGGTSLAKKSSTHSECMFPEYLNIKLPSMDSIITFDIVSLVARPEEDRFLDFFKGKKIDDMDSLSVYSTTMTDNDGNERLIFFATEDQNKTVTSTGALKDMDTRPSKACQCPKTPTMCKHVLNTIERYERTHPNLMVFGKKVRYDKLLGKRNHPKEDYNESFLRLRGGGGSTEDQDNNDIPLYVWKKRRGCYGSKCPMAKKLESVGVSGFAERKQENLTKKDERSSFCGSFFCPEGTRRSVALQAVFSDDELSESSIRFGCGHRHCPAAKKFKKLGLGPLAIEKCQGTLYGPVQIPVEYGLSQTYGVWDTYGPFGIFSKTNTPFLPEEDNCDEEKRPVLRLRGGGETTSEIDSNQSSNRSYNTIRKVEDCSSMTRSLILNRKFGTVLRLRGGGGTQHEYSRKVRPSSAPTKLKLEVGRKTTDIKNAGVILDLRDKEKKTKVEYSFMTHSLLSEENRPVLRLRSGLTRTVPDEDANTTRSLSLRERVTTIKTQVGDYDIVHCSSLSKKNEQVQTLTEKSKAKENCGYNKISRLRAGGTTKKVRKSETALSPIFECREVMEKFDEILQEYREAVQGLSKSESNYLEQYMDPSSKGFCGHPRCTYISEPILPPIHWDCPDPLPIGLCQNPDCPYLPQDLKRIGKILADRQKLNPAINTNLSNNNYSTSAPECTFSKKISSTNPTQKSGCCCYNRNYVVNTMRVQRDTNEDSEICCANPNCPLREIISVCSDPECPFEKGDSMIINGTYLNPSYSHTLKAMIESCSNPECPFKEIPEPCSNPDCPFKQLVEPNPDCSLREPPNETCPNPECPFKEISKPCSNPDCPFKEPPKPSTEIRQNSESPRAKTSLQGAGDDVCSAENVCENPICPPNKSNAFMMRGDSECKCDNPDCPANIETCSNTECPFNIRDAEICENPQCPHRMKRKTKVCGPVEKSVCADVTCPFRETNDDQENQAEKNMGTLSELQALQDGILQKKSGTRPSEYEFAPCKLSTCKTMGGKLKCQDCATLTVGMDVGPCPKVCPGDLKCPLALTTTTTEEIKRKSRISTKKIIKRERKKFMYHIGDKYPGVHVGHKECVITQLNVPHKMGWLWNVHTPCLNLKPRKGWRPGYIGKTILESIQAHRKALNMPLLEISKARRRKNYGIESEFEMVRPKPTLQIQRKEGVYYITMNPLKDPNTLVKNESPYMECKPMQFKIVKNKENKENDYKTCLCTDQGIVYEPLESSSSSSESELDIEFTPPAGLIHPENFTKIKNVVHIDTQYYAEDFLTLSQKKAQEHKKKNKKKKSKK